MLTARAPRGLVSAALPDLRIEYGSGIAAEKNRQLRGKKFFDLCLHLGIHFDERRPRAFETFAGQFFRRVDTQFAADGDFARRMVEHVGWTLGENAVALRIGVRGEVE